MAVDLDFDLFAASSSSLSLLPRTLARAPNAAAAAELASFRAFPESMTLKGSAELVEQAQAISKSNLNILSMDPEDRDEAVLANGKDHPRDRRPALGRKRAQFSWKPESSQTVPNVDVNSIEDPEEYFLACENLDNAERELKKLKRGVSAELVQHPQSTAARKRRPGISGKTVTYKHRFPDVAVSAEGAMLSQHEMSDRGKIILSQTIMNVDSSSLLHPKEIDQPQSSQVMEVNISVSDPNEEEGSVKQKEKKIDDLFSSLLSYEDLDGEKGQAFLREQLQIPKIDVGKMHLPCLFSSQKDNVNTVNNISVTKKLGNSEHLQTSPTIPKSPLAAIFALQRRLSLKNSLKDQYLLHPSDEVLLTGKSTLNGGPEKHLISSLVDIDHCDTSGVIVDVASTSTRTRVKISSLADVAHSPVSNSDKVNDNMITSWKSHKLISLKDLSKNQDLMHPSDDTLYLGEFSQSRNNDTCPISSSVDNDRHDASVSIPDGNSTPARTKGKSLTFGNKLQSPLSRADRTFDNKVTSKQHLMEHSPSLPERNSGSYTTRFDYDKNTAVEFDDRLGEKDDNMQPDSGRLGSNKVALSVEFDHSLREENSAELDASVSIQMEPGLKDLSSESVNPNAQEDCACHLGSRTRRHAYNNAFGYDATTEGEVNDMVQAEQHSKDSEAVKDKCDTPQRVSPTDGHLEITCVALEENNVELQLDLANPYHGRRNEKGPSRRQWRQKLASKRQSPENSRMSPGEGRKQETAPCAQKKNKSMSRRQSLAGAGTAWQAGVRRSTRIKSRPLQYWCGERFLFGRIHDSLPTVVGVKYASPSDAKLKVKSYVSDEYSALLLPYNLH